MEFVQKSEKMWRVLLAPVSGGQVVRFINVSIYIKDGGNQKQVSRQREPRDS